MFKKIHWILTSPDGPIKIQYSRPLYLEVHSALIEYENKKAKPAYYLVRVIDYNDGFQNKEDLLLILL